MTDVEYCPNLYICPQVFGGKCPHADNCSRGFMAFDDEIPGLSDADWGHLDDPDEPNLGEARRRAQADRAKAAEKVPDE